jgi:hypothetical protein
MPDTAQDDGSGVVVFVIVAIVFAAIGVGAFAAIAWVV